MRRCNGREVDRDSRYRSFEGLIDTITQFRAAPISVDPLFDVVLVGCILAAMERVTVEPHSLYTHG